MSQFNVFFSWQSDIIGNKKIINGALGIARKKLKDKGYVIAVDEATRGISGTPNISQTIFNKIKNCDIFVGDLTPVASDNEKLIPNPNVAIELGYALALLPQERIIVLAANSGYKAEQLPFDINHNRILFFDVKTQLQLTSPIEGCIQFILKNDKVVLDHLFSDLGIKKNIASFKYIPETYLEIDELKDHLRYFVDPYTFYTLFFEKLKKSNFAILNRMLTIEGKAIFQFNPQKFKESVYDINFHDTSDYFKKIDNYLHEKEVEIDNNSNATYFFSKKLSDRRKDLSFMSKKICLITSKAGQGKTNFVCDFARGVLLPRYIPFILINGFEITSGDVAGSMARYVYPDRTTLFSDILNYISNYCYRQHKPFVIIIDGINENPNFAHFKNSLTNFIYEMQRYDFVKIILTCRTEYYDENFKKDIGLFKDVLVEVKDLNRRLEKVHLDILISTYFSYFNVNTPFISDTIREKFGDNLLLLRIFCEAYQGQKINPLYSLFKDDLFRAYYFSMKEKLVEVLKKEGFNDCKGDDVDLFLSTIAGLMVDANKFVNINIKDVKSKLTANQVRIFNRFLDENILVKRDLYPNESNIFKDEVVNFTYDEFRDYIISSYILMQSSRNATAFAKYVSNYTQSVCPLAEGLKQFLFIQSRKSLDDTAISVIKKQEWYNDCYKKFVWELDDNILDKNDVLFVKYFVKTNDYDTVVELVYHRWNCDIFKKLNIQILIDFLITLADDDLNKYLNKAFNPAKNLMYQSMPSDRENLFNEVEKVLFNKELIMNKSIHKLFSFILFFTAYDFTAEDLYMQYLRISNNVSAAKNIMNKTNSGDLMTKIRKIIEDYENRI